MGGFAEERLPQFLKRLKFQRGVSRAGAEDRHVVFSKDANHILSLGEGLGACNPPFRGNVRRTVHVLDTPEAWEKRATGTTDSAIFDVRRSV